MATSNQTIRQLFSTERSIDRPIEKVIDYSRADAKRLAAEVQEYEVTPNVLQGIQKFLDKFGDGVRGGEVIETAIWVSGFYGSGKSSFTKYLGYALDPNRMIGERAFVELFADRIPEESTRQELRTLARQHPTAVIMLDLGSEQLASSATSEVSNVLYRKVLQWAGYSQIDKLAELELKLDRSGAYGSFRDAYLTRHNSEWNSDHNDPLVAVSRADRLVPEFFPDEFPEPGVFRSLQYTVSLNAREQVEDMLDIIERKSGYRNVLFLIDEVGQYVAPKGELILNLDGLARNLKELGQGRVWIMATGQQTLAEIVEKAAYNSTELNKLKDRFPVAIELDARDIREITHRRLLRKSPEGEAQLRSIFQQYGQALATHTRLSDSALYKGDVDVDSFVNLYPFLPSHFDVLLNFISRLATASGGLGLRSAIRVIQDMLIDASRVLPPGASKLADSPVGELATADRFYDALRNDIAKLAPHSVTGVERIEKIFPDDTTALRVGKTIAVLQQLPNVPRTPANIAALLYRTIGTPPNIEAVQAVLDQLLATAEVGLVNDPQGGGLAFLDEGVRPIREKRNAFQPTSAEIARKRSDILKSVFAPLPTASMEGSKTIRAGIRFGTQPIDGHDNEIQFQIETAPSTSWDERRTSFLTATSGTSPEWRNTIVWLMEPPDGVEDALRESLRSDHIIREHPEHQADQPTAQFIRAERRALEAHDETARRLYRDSLLNGISIFRGKPTPARAAGIIDVDSAARTILQAAGREVYDKYFLVRISPKTDLAVRLLEVDKLDRVPTDTDPLNLVAKSGGQAAIDASHPALQEVLALIRDLATQDGSQRVQGSKLQDTLAAAPYGWSKDAVRYLVAGLLMAGSITLSTVSGLVQGRGPKAIEALKNTLSFNKVGVSLREIKPQLGQLLLAATRLSELVGFKVNGLEDQIQSAARNHLDPLLDPLALLPYKLKTLGLPGAERAEQLLDWGKQIESSDGAEAISILGSDASTFVDDYQWAKRSQQALDDGEQLIAQIRTLQRDIQELANLDSDIIDIWQQYDTAIAEVLQSESFAARLADLRSTARKIRQDLIVRYATDIQTYEQALKDLLARLESHPRWTTLSDEDRQDIASRLELDVPPAISEGSEITDLRRLYLQKLNVARLELQLRHEIDLKQPVKPHIIDGFRPVPVQAVIGGHMVAGEVLTEADLDEWLEQVRSAVRQVMLNPDLVEEEILA